MFDRRGFFAAVVGMASALFATRKTETVFDFTNRRLREKNLQCFGARDTRSKVATIKAGDSVVLASGDDILVSNGKSSILLRGDDIYLDGVIVLNRLGIKSLPWAQS